MFVVPESQYNNDLNVLFEKLKKTDLTYVIIKYRDEYILLQKEDYEPSFWQQVSKHLSCTKVFPEAYQTHHQTNIWDKHTLEMRKGELVEETYQVLRNSFERSNAPYSWWVFPL
jgi:hypothetical protein